MITALDMTGKEHSIRLCILEDVPIHFDCIKEHIAEVEEFKLRMIECIEAGTAYTSSDGKCFLYYLSEEIQPKFASGVAIYGSGSPMKMMALFSHVFTHLDKFTFVIKLLPHSGTFVSECKSMLSVSSIKSYKLHNSPLVIRIDKVRDKVLAIKRKRGVV